MVLGHSQELELVEAHVGPRVPRQSDRGHTALIRMARLEDARRGALKTSARTDCSDRVPVDPARGVNVARTTTSTDPMGSTRTLGLAVSERSHRKNGQGSGARCRGRPTC
jgi:hypothetical protein